MYTVFIETECTQKILDDRSPNTWTRQQRKAGIWAVTAAVGFAATSGFSQAAAATGNEALSMLITRKVAFAAGLAACILVLGCVSLAGLWPHSEHASVTSSIFSMITIILAWAFLNEPMTRTHWICVSLTF